MLYRLDSQYHDSNYIFIDWERLDACLKPSDRDKAGRLCGKRATSDKRRGKIKAGSKEAKKLANEVRKSKYKEPGGSPQQLQKIKNRRKEEAQLQRNFMYGEGGQSPQQKAAAKRKSVRNLGKSNLSEGKKSRLTELREKKNRKLADEESKRIAENIDRRVKAEFEEMKKRRTK